MAVFRVVSPRQLLLKNWIESRSRPSALILARNYPETIISQHVQFQHSSVPAKLSSSAPSCTRPLSTTNVSNSPTSSSDVEKDTLDLTFCDAKAAFRSKTNFEILRAYIVFSLCKVKFLVDNNAKLMSLGKAVLGRTIFHQVMKLSFYGHFVAGENQVSIQPQIERLRSFGVKAILDYSVEEDISEEQATKAEMESCSPVDATAGKATKGSEGYVQYKAHEGFADRRAGVGAARTYFYMNEAQCEKNMEIFIQSIEAVSGATKGTGFAAIKVTALGRPQLLLHLSEAIARVHKYVSGVTGGKEGYVSEAHIKPEDLQKRLERAGKKDPTVQSWLQNMTGDDSGLIHILPWQGVIAAQKKVGEAMKVANLSTGEMQDLLPPLTPVEEEMFGNMMRRLHTIFRVAQKMDVRVMVDAEQTYFQPAISRLAMEMSRIYNKEKAIVFNTYQCYLKESLHILKLDLEQSERQKFYFGCKLVRGAYMVQERARAHELGYGDPVCEDFEATTEMYQSCLMECLQRISKRLKTDRPKQFSVMAATHNEDTVRFAIQKMKEYGIQPSDRVICFGQLYGMCDQISFPLGQSGFSVYKYVPYGPVDGVLPYLSRRAQENGGMLKKVDKEKKLLRQELTRRLLTGQITYTPKGKYEPI